MDVSVLPHLTDQDLKDIGVPLGPRRKILAAITAEAGTTTRRLSPPSALSQRRKTPPSAAKSPSCSQTCSALRSSRPAWTRKIYGAYQRLSEVCR